MQSIYLDHNATTPIRPEVVEAIVRCWTDYGANPASRHQLGQQARRVLEDAREGLAELLGADLSSPNPDKLVFTSGGTEANNLAVFGIAKATQSSKPDALLVSTIEHASVIQPAERLMEQGWRLDTLSVDSSGTVRADCLPSLLEQGPRLVSVMCANHETGVLQPVSELAALCNSAGVRLHTDAVQAVGKVAINFRQLGVSALSLSGHKFYGPVGIGGLLLRHDVPLEPVFYGGHQQKSLRPGTESVALAVGMLTALRLCEAERIESTQRLETLRDQFERTLKFELPNIVIHGESALRLAQTSNIQFPGLSNQALFAALDSVGISCSIGSACDSDTSDLSPTLLAMGLSSTAANSSLRFSLGATNGQSELTDAAHRIASECRRVLAL